MRISAIAAMDEDRVIGNKGELPWHIPEDLKRFSRLTKGHAVMMGRKTYFSLPENARPLPERQNIVITRDPSKLEEGEGVEVQTDPVDYLKLCKQGVKRIESPIIWICGGQQIYELTSELWDDLYLTIVPGKHKGDAYFPKVEGQFELVKEEEAEECRFLLYRR